MAGLDGWRGWKGIGGLMEGMEVMEMTKTVMVEVEKMAVGMEKEMATTTVS